MSDAADLITLVFGGKTFRCTRRTAAHLAWTAEQLERRHPNARIVVIQGCYNTTVDASAGTHELDAVLDVQIVGLDWDAAQRFLRECGWAAWVRSPPAFSWHIHMVSLGYPGRVGIYVPGQVADYYAHRSGLKGHVADNTWHPADIDSTVFDYPAWLAAQEDAMPYTDWPQKDRDALLADIRQSVLDAVLDGGKLTVAAALKRGASAAERVKRLAKDLGKPQP